MVPFGALAIHLPLKMQQQYDFSWQIFFVMLGISFATYICHSYKRHLYIVFHIMTNNNKAIFRYW